VCEPPRRYSWEDYLYPAAPGQPDVLRNHLGLTDLAQWHVAERVLTHGRYAELVGNPELVPQTFDVAHWKSIHHHLFQDMYEWAGQFRTVNMSNGGHVFLDEAWLVEQAEGFLANAREAGMFAGRDKAGVVQGLAATLQGVNMIHPFRYLQSAA
jgi:cell filamentation protein